MRFSRKKAVIFLSSFFEKEVQIFTGFTREFMKKKKPKMNIRFLGFKAGRYDGVQAQKTPASKQKKPSCNSHSLFT